MTQLIGRLEPLFWMLFGAGAFAVSMLLPGLFLAFAFGFPFGWFGTPVETFARARLLIANPLGKLVLGALIPLAFWHSAHHLRHFAYDVGVHDRAGGFALALYGLALLGTIAAIGVVAGL
jgi:fumarate reductase subunit D